MPAIANLIKAGDATIAPVAHHKIGLTIIIVDKSLKLLRVMPTQPQGIIESKHHLLHDEDGPRIPMTLPWLFWRGKYEYQFLGVLVFKESNLVRSDWCTRVRISSSFGAETR